MVLDSWKSYGVVNSASINSLILVIRLIPTIPLSHNYTDVCFQNRNHLRNQTTKTRWSRGYWTMRTCLSLDLWRRMERLSPPPPTHHPPTITPAHSPHYPTPTKTSAGCIRTLKARYKVTGPKNPHEYRPKWLFQKVLCPLEIEVGGGLITLDLG